MNIHLPPEAIWRAASAAPIPCTTAPACEETNRHYIKYRERNVKQGRVVRTQKYMHQARSTTKAIYFHCIHALRALLAQTSRPGNYQASTDIQMARCVCVVTHKRASRNCELKQNLFTAATPASKHSAQLAEQIILGCLVCVYLCTRAYSSQHRSIIRLVEQQQQQQQQQRRWQRRSESASCASARALLLCWWLYLLAINKNKLNYA